MESPDGVSHEVIAERAPVGLLVLDENGVIEWVSEEYATLLGEPREDFVGTPFPELVDAGYYESAVLDQWEETVRTLLSSSNDIERETYRVRTHVDGETFVYDVSTALLPRVDGEFRGTVHAFRDVTAQKTYEQELRRQNERLDEFASVVSHDLRNPLTVANGYLDIAEESGDSEAFERVRQAHERMGALIDDLLSLARSGEQVRDADPVAVSAVARKAWRSVATDGATLDVHGDIGRVPADESRTRRLFENLYRNAVEHASENVTVTVGPLADADGFFVADDGPGIPESERERVFDRGYSTADKGTGLGLAIVRTIADAHGWTVSATESASGGARFEVRTSPTVPL